MPPIPAALLPHRVTISPYIGEGPRGAVYGVAVANVRAFVEAKRRRVLDDKGNRVVSNTTVILLLSAVCPPRSKVTLPNGTTSTVVVHSDHDGGGLPTPDHQEVALI